MRPRLFETDTAWEIYSNLSPEQQTYANVARTLTKQLNLDPPLTPQAISNRFIKAGLVEKKPRGAPKLKNNPLSGVVRSRRKRHRDKVFAEIAENDFVVKVEPQEIKIKSVGRPRELETNIAVEAYRKHGSIEKAACAIGCSYSAVRARLQEAGVVKRKGRPSLGDRALSKTERNKKWKEKKARTNKVVNVLK